MDGIGFSDLKNVVWSSTIKLALARGFSTGLIFMIIQLLMAPSLDGHLMELISIPFIFAVFALPMALFCMGLGWLLGMIIPLMGVMTHWIGALAVFLGDPLVYFFNRQYPEAIGIADFSFYNFVPIIFVFHPE